MYWDVEMNTLAHKTLNKHLIDTHKISYEDDPVLYTIDNYTGHGHFINEGYSLYTPSNDMLDL